MLGDDSSAKRLDKLVFNSNDDFERLTQWLLLHHQENSVDELDVLGQVIELEAISIYQSNRASQTTYIVKRNQWLGPAISSADVLIETMSPKRGNKLFKEENEQTPTYRSKHEVVDLEKTIQLVWLSVLHDFSSSKYDHQIEHNHDDCLFECGHRGLSWYEFEFLCRISHDRSPCFVEIRPGREAHGTDESWTVGEATWNRHD